MTAGIWQVRFRFAAEEVAPPELARVGDETTVSAYVRRETEHGRSVRPDPQRTLVWHATPHLVECVAHTEDDTIEARYLFDGAYAAAHPEALDADHLAILHGTIAAKMFDDGVMVLDDAGLAASLRWPATRRRGVRLTRSGQRSRSTGS